MEDVLTLAKGVPVEHNAQLVERAVRLGELAQRPPMTPAEARDLLQTKRRLSAWSSLRVLRRSSLRRPSVGA